MADQNWASLINCDRALGGIISEEGSETEKIAIKSTAESSTSYNIIADDLFSELDLLEKKSRTTISLY